MTASPGRPGRTARRPADHDPKALDSGIVVVNDRLRRLARHQKLSALAGVSYRSSRAGPDGQASRPPDEGAALVTVGASHVAVYNWTFLLSQSLCAQTCG
jgi:hypothetical protein